MEGFTQRPALMMKKLCPTIVLCVVVVVKQIIVIVAFPDNQRFDRLFHFLFELLNDENHFSNFNYININK